MNHGLKNSLLALSLLIGALTGAASAIAAEPDGTSRRDPNYQGDVTVCGYNQQDRAACRREAGAARQAVRRGELTGASKPDYLRNALARCGSHPPAEREACERRVRGTGDTTIDGSVYGGGLIRETVETIPAPQP